MWREASRKYSSSRWNPYRQAVAIRIANPSPAAARTGFQANGSTPAVASDSCGSDVAASGWVASTDGGPDRSPVTTRTPSHARPKRQRHRSRDRRADARRSAPRAVSATLNDSNMATHPLRTRANLLAHALTLPGAFEDHPWGEA